MADGSIENMFDSRLHDYWEPPDTAASRATLGEIAAATRAENRAAARRLAAIGRLFEMRRAERGEAADWAVDTWAAVGAEVAAVLRVSLGKAGSYLNYAHALQRLPAVGAVFAAGDIDMHAFQTVVYRTALVTDEDVLAEVDRRIAARAARWPSMTRGRLAREIDRIVGRHDPEAVRRERERTRDRDVTIWEPADGTADISGRLFATDAHLLDKRLDALAATVCDDDPRTLPQRRADALGALAAGADRLSCRCAGASCPAGAKGASPAVVIHVVAEQATLDGDSRQPGYLLGADALIPAEALRDIAPLAEQRPLRRPADEAERGYRPSQSLIEFVRARDLTCRAPGCDRPAVDCDVDHTVPHSRGGCTHASNLKCLCRFHHLVKTFWGWQDRQLADGTVIWTLPDGQTYVTTPGSALLFPALLAPTPAAPSRPAGAPGGDRSLRMPRRTSSRVRNRARAVAAERSRNRRAILAARPPEKAGDDPPPF